MRNIYTAQFEILPLDRDTEAVAYDVREAVLSWISTWYESKQGLNLLIPENGQLEPMPEHSIECSEASSERASVKSVLWSYPHKDNLHWTVLVEIARFECTLEFSLRLIIESTQFFIAPLNFDFGRPRIVVQILRGFACYYGGAKLSAEALVVSAGEVPQFVKDRINSQSRRLPIVIVSPESFTNSSIISSSHLAESIAGIAEVYVLADKWASFALTDCVGRNAACYNGAIRIYWPLGAKTLEALCPVYLPNVIRDRGATFIEKALLREFSSISSFRFIRGPVATDADSVLDDVRKSEQAKLRKAAADRGDFEGLADSYKEEADGLRKENDRLRASTFNLTSELTQLRSQLEVNQANLAAVFTTIPSGAAVPSPSTTEQKTDLKIPEVVGNAQRDYVELLSFTKNALRAAESTPYKQPERVAEALEAMSVVCEAWRESRRTKQSTGSFEDLFESLGFTYKARESQTSVGKWPEEYQMLYKGQKVSIQPHLALGAGGPETCLRIQFHIDEVEQMFVIDHVGRHKTNTST